jgi:hypothetical protein
VAGPFTTLRELPHARPDDVHALHQLLLGEPLRAVVWQRPSELPRNGSTMPRSVEAQGPLCESLSKYGDCARSKQRADHRARQKAMVRSSMTRLPFPLHLALGLLSFSWLAPVQAQWTQVGADIIGQLPNERAGFVADLNAAGDRLALGAPWNSTNGIRCGKVRVFQFDGSDWTPLGADLPGDNAEDEFGSAVKLSADGNTLAIGAPERWVGPAGTPPGYVRVFDWDGTEWVQRGNDLSGGVDRDGFGAAIDLSASGDIIAIGAPYDATLANFAGRASVHQWTGMAWMPLGGAVAGTANCFTGGAVQLNNAGTVLAVGQEGQARVLVFDRDGSEWIARDTLLGLQNFGNSISMDASGNAIAVGGESLAVSNGRVKVFQFTGSGYVPKGSPIDGQGDELFLGWEQYALALREDGNALVAGSLGIVDGLNLGSVRELQFNGQEWIQAGGIPGSGISEQIGRSVSMSADGSILAIGTPYSNGDVPDAGIVRVYTNSMSTGTADIQRTNVDIVVLPNPARDYALIRSNSGILSYELRSPTGQVVASSTIRSEREHPLDLSSLSAGTYFLKITTTALTATVKLVRE